MRDRVNKLGVSEPEIRKQGTDQIVDPARRGPRPSAGGRDDRLDRRSSVLRLRDDLARPPSMDAHGNAGRDAELYELLKQVQTRREGRAGGVLPLQDARRRRRSRRRRAEADDGTAHSVRAPAPDAKASCCSRYGGKAARGLPGAEGAGAPQSSPAPPRPPAASAPPPLSPNGTYYYLFKYFPNNTTARRSHR